MFNNCSIFLHTKYRHHKLIYANAYCCFAVLYKRWVWKLLVIEFAAWAWVGRTSRNSRRVTFAKAISFTLFSHFSTDKANLSKLREPPSSTSLKKTESVFCIRLCYVIFLFRAVVLSSGKRNIYTHTGGFRYFIVAVDTHARQEIDYVFMLMRAVAEQQRLNYQLTVSISWGNIGMLAPRQIPIILWRCRKLYIYIITIIIFTLIIRCLLKLFIAQ